MTWDRDYLRSKCYTSPASKTSVHGVQEQLIIRRMAVTSIWIWFGLAEEGMFSSSQNTTCTLWFSLSPQDNLSLGVDALTLALIVAVCFFSLHLIPPLLQWARKEKLNVIQIAPTQASKQRVQLLHGPSWLGATTQKSNVSFFKRDVRSILSFHELLPRKDFFTSPHKSIQHSSTVISHHFCLDPLP